MKSGWFPVCVCALVATGTATAVERESLFISGYTEAVSNVVYNDLGVAKWGGRSDATTSDITGAAQFEIDALIGEQVHLRGEVFADIDGVVLEEALASWQIDAVWSLHLGRFETYIGWEGLDAPDLTRVNFHNAGLASDVVSYLDGASLRAVLGDRAAIGFYVAQEILDRGDIALPDSQGGRDLGLGAEVTFLLDDQDSYLDIDFAFDTYSTGGGTGKDAVYAVNVNSQYNAETMPLAIYGEVNYSYWDDDGTVGPDGSADAAHGLWAMLGLSYGLTPYAVATVMADWINPSTEVADDDEIELAAALLTNPSGDANFACNFEVAYVHGHKDNSIGLFVEFLAILP